MTDFPVEDEQRIRAEIGDNPTDLAARIYELEQKLELAGRSVIQAREACVWWADEYRTAESRATTAEQNDALSMAMRTYLENKLARAESHLSTTRSALERIAAGTGRSTWVDIARAALKELE